MTAEPVLHIATKDAVDRVIAAQTHAVILAGPTGAGKGSIARYIATRHLGLDDTTRLASQAYFRVVGDEASITVEDIRSLRQFLSLKTTGTRDVRRVVIIEHANTMNDESQNALLKSLEEPPADTVFILNADDEHGLRDTIRSRAQTVQIVPPAKQQAVDFFAGKHDSAAVERAYQMSGGHMGLMEAMLSADNEHPFMQEIAHAKQLLSVTQFDRLRQVDELSKQRSQVSLLLAALRRIASSALQQAANRSQDSSVVRWHRTLKAVHQAEAAMRHNPNLKLLLTDLFLNI